MKIGYVLSEFPPLSETFIRREVQGLADLGHTMLVYTNQRHRDPLVPDPSGRQVTIREVAFLGQANPEGLIALARQDGVDHLHSSLSIPAQKAAFAAARRLQIPFTLTAYSGYDIFTARDPNLYHTISRDDLCQGIIVEDAFMHEWLVDHLGADPARLVTIANSFDLDLYRLRQPRPVRPQVVVLAIARFVEKKGLVHLVHAFRTVAQAYPQAVLWLVGRGPEEARLRQAAAGNPAVHFLGAVTEARTRELYAQADISCLPCVRTAQGDGDGIPTTILEAMAFEMPVVSSNLLSTPAYISEGVEGFLTQPGDVSALAQALSRLCASADLRQTMGRAARARVEAVCDLRTNIRRLEGLMLAGRAKRWRVSLDALVERRKVYTSAESQRYNSLRERAARFFNPPPGRLLDVGCGYGLFDGLFAPQVQYMGVDPLPLVGKANFPFSRGLGERLPFPPDTFDALMIYGSLVHVQNVDDVLAEARRVLKPGGMIFFHEPLNDPNPTHLNHFSAQGLAGQIARYFGILQQQALDGYLMLRGQKPGSVQIVAAPAVTTPASAAPVSAQPPPLVSIGIPVYNRQRYLREAIDSVLAQTYRPVEVVVVDDGSSDSSRAIIESYGEAVQVVFHPSNRGIAAAKNSALRGSSPQSRYVGMLDSDDVFLPEFVARCVHYLEHHPAVGLVYTDDILMDANGNLLAQRQAVEPWTVEGWLRTCNLRGDTWLARRDLVMQTRLHDERMSFDVDYDLFYQLLLITPFAHLPEPLAKIRSHSEQSTRATLELARCHAANLVRYGYSAEYAYLRARRHPEWIPAIEEGIRLGHALRAETEQ